MRLSDLLFPLTALLGNIDLFSWNKHSLKYPPNMLALCWHGTPAYHAFYYASISDARLPTV